MSVDQAVLVWTAAHEYRIFLNESEVAINAVCLYSNAALTRLHAMARLSRQVIKNLSHSQYPDPQNWVELTPHRPSK